MEKSEVKINVTAKDGEVIIRHGEAERILDLHQTHHVDGLISTPAIYALFKIKAIDPAKAIVVVIRNEGVIELSCDPNNKRANIITGRIKPNPEFTKFGINNDKRYSPQALGDLLKMNRIYFPEKDDNLALVSNLKNMKIKSEQEVEQSGDDRGNNKNSIESKVKGNIPESFTLCMPLHEGGKDVTFLVNICIEVRDNGISLWLQSVEANEAIMKYSNEVIDGEIKKLKTIGLLVLEI